MYADDRATVTECRKQLHGALENWEELLEKHGLKMNLDKTEAMWVGKQKELNIRLEGKCIKQVIRQTRNTEQQLVFGG